MNRKTTRKPSAVKAVEVVRTAKPAEAAEAKQDIKAKLKQIIDDAKVRSQDNRLVMLGLIANSRKAGDERKANLIEAGRAYQPELDQKIEEVKSKFKFDGAEKFSLKLPKLGQSAAKKGEPSRLQTMLDERMAKSFERFGLPTRKEFDTLSKKVDKLIALQSA